MVGSPAGAGAAGAAAGGRAPLGAQRIGAELGSRSRSAPGTPWFPGANCAGGCGVVSGAGDSRVPRASEKGLCSPAAGHVGIWEH